MAYRRQAFQGRNLTYLWLRRVRRFWNLEAKDRVVISKSPQEKPRFAIPRGIFFHNEHRPMDDHMV